HAERATRDPLDGRGLALERRLELLEHAALGRAQALRVEVAVGAGELLQLDEDRAHHAPRARRAAWAALGPGSSRPRRLGQVERGVLAQHLQLELAQRRAGLDALLAQQRRDLAVAAERLDLAAAAVQREHAQRLQPLAARVRRRERLELDRDLDVAGEREVG